MIFYKIGAQQVFEAAKLSSESVRMLEAALGEFDDQPEDFEPNLLSSKHHKKRKRRRNGKTYKGKTPRTNLKPKFPFDHVFDLHDEYARNNTHDFGVLGEYPFR